MSYRELVDNGADTSELQKYLSLGDMGSTTIRIPDNLKDAAYEEAKLRGVSFSAFVRMSLIAELTKAR